MIRSLIAECSQRGIAERSTKVLITILGLGMVLIGGCGTILDGYGETQNYTARKSLNGFSAFRETFAASGSEVKDANRLNQRTLTSDAIVWIPQSPGGIESETSQWLNRWLRQGGRTLIYVIPDSGSATDYYREAARMAPADQRMEYRRRHAEELIDRMNWQAARQNTTSNGWFDVTPLPGDVSLSAESGLNGPWADGVKSSDASAVPMSVEFTVSPYVEDENAKATAAAGMGGFFSAPTGPTQSSFGFPTGAVKASVTDLDEDSLLSTNQGDVIMRFTGKAWKDSQLIVIAGGSLLTNFSLAHPPGRQLASRLIEQTETVSGSESPMVVSFSTTPWNSIPIRKSDGEYDPPSGMEFLTTWPLSLVTIHGLIAGLIACLVMLPIFGRPRRLVRRNLANFGGHLDAVAALFMRRDSENFAESRIREYRRVVKGED